MEIYRGLVLAERSAGERGKFIDVLTEHNTVREIYVRGAKKNTSAGLSATQLFSYANFSIRKQQKGLYLACLAVVFAATAAGVLALRSVLNHVVELTGTAQEETPWQDDTTVNKPDTTQPEPVRTPAPASSASPSSNAASGVPAASPTPAASAAPSGAAAKSSDFWQGKVLAPYSGDELVYNATLGDWRTHNGVDAAAAAGDEVPAVKGGRVSVVEDDALWGGVVEIVDANGCTWRYCGVTPSCVVGGDAAAGDVIGVVAAIPAEADLASHVHLECLKDGAWMKPEI